jgi:fatty acid synthase subunit alpha
VNEFGVIPERVEDMTITDLGEILQSTYEGHLGKQTSVMIERVITSRMPGGFSTSAVRKYLEGRWGFAAGRQDSVLLGAIVTPPSTRFKNKEDAHSYFDKIVHAHASAAGISLNKSGDGEGSCVQSSLFDPEALRLLSEEQNSLSKKHLELYANHLNIDLHAQAKGMDASATIIKKLQNDLDLWNEEHGDVYASGIRPMFSKNKVRHFNSWWNWAIQDVLSLFHDLIASRLEYSSPEYPSHSVRIVNRCNSEILEVIRYLIGLCRKVDTDVYRLTRTTLEHLLLECSQTTGQPMFRKTPATSPDDNDTPISLSHKTIKQKWAGEWKFDEPSTKTYQNALDQISASGLKFEGKNVLLTGSGVGSIGAEILRGLLEGGAKVLVTTSSFSTDTMNFYQDIYVSCGGPGSELVVVPFNQGSQLDLDGVLAYIYDTSRDGLGWDLDAVIPFAAISEAGREIDKIDSRSELAHRIMLTNTIRLIALVKKFKETNGCDSRPAQVILPLSANHGCFGSDGLYSESKLGLESLFDKWRSENWCNYLSICGASIGWTRGTGLMCGNDAVASSIESLGVQTFSQQEMAAYILALLSPDMTDICQSSPLYADLNGGLDAIEDLSRTLATIRNKLNEAAEIREAIAEESLIERNLLNEIERRAGINDTIHPRSYIDLGFPHLPDYESEIQSLSSQLEGMVDLGRVAVITGFAELGPHGNARTRWEREALGAFSTEGCIEMAWIMGLIKYTPNRQIKGELYSGWVDAKSEEPIADHQVKQRYEKDILAHSGIRLVEPALWGDGYDPHKKQLLQEVAIQADLEPFNASKDMAEAFTRQQREFAEISQIPGSSSEFRVFIKKGATLIIPKAIDFETDVAGQLPTGWDPRRYGISDDVVSQVDPITLYTLICTVEALLCAGISDPYEIYQFIHTSKLANCIGTGVGGVASASRMYKGRSTEKQVSKDVLQETFLNTVGAWVNMLLLSSNGPIRTPVGACATALESLDSAHDLIMTGKAEMCLVGGVDDLEEHMTFEFANMKATSNSALEHASGRSPSEMSRPTSSSRRGFMESQGCGSK